MFLCIHSLNEKTLKTSNIPLLVLEVPLQIFECYNQIVKNCVFCLENNLLKGQVFLRNDEFYFCDTEDPVLTKSGMIIPHRHISTPFDFTEREWLSLKQILNEAKKYLDKFNPDGYNIGWNAGKAGGQIIEHVHLHIIARFKDSPMPAGEYVITSKVKKISGMHCK